MRVDVYSSGTSGENLVNATEYVYGSVTLPV